MKLEEIKPCPDCHTVPLVRKLWEHRQNPNYYGEQVSVRLAFYCKCNKRCSKKDMAATTLAEANLSEKEYAEIAEKLWNMIIRDGWNAQKDGADDN